MLQVLPMIPGYFGHRKVLLKTHTHFPSRGMDKNKSALYLPTEDTTQTVI